MTINTMTYDEWYNVLDSIFVKETGFSAWTWPYYNFEQFWMNGFTPWEAFGGYCQKHFNGFVPLDK